MVSIITCTGCGKPKIHNQKEQWWSCNGYFGFSGDFCSSCFDKISHDSYRNPKHPEEYLLMLLKSENRQEKMIS